MSTSCIQPVMTTVARRGLHAIDRSPTRIHHIIMTTVVRRGLHVIPRSATGIHHIVMTTVARRGLHAIDRSPTCIHHITMTTVARQNVHTPAGNLGLMDVFDHVAMTTVPKRAVHTTTINNSLLDFFCPVVNITVASRSIHTTNKNTNQMKLFGFVGMTTVARPTVHTTNKNTDQMNLSRFIGMTTVVSRGVHMTTRNAGLMDFFDAKSHWAEETVKTGRPWRLDELRIKSNPDLHKLWYVLLKERNMLMTMEAEYKRQCELLPSPERIFKVEESMENLLEVVAERDRAVNLLETGKTGEPEFVERRNIFGLTHRYRTREYAIPREMNRIHRTLYPPYQKYMDKFLCLFREKRRKEENLKTRLERRRLRKLKAAFPHADIDVERDAPLKQ